MGVRNSGATSGLESLPSLAAWLLPVVFESTQRRAPLSVAKAKSQFGPFADAGPQPRAVGVATTSSDHFDLLT